MIVETMVFLVMLFPNTEQPVMGLMHAFPTARECNAALKLAPKERQWACIKIDLKPEDEKEVKKV
jgi:hypothetical protein